MRLKNLIIAGILLPASGCANQDIIVHKQAEMESRVEYLAQANKVLSGQVAALSNDVNELRDRVRDHSSTLRELSEPSGEATDQAQERAGQGEQVAKKKTSVTRIELINTDTKSKGKTDSSTAAYMKAFGLYSANK
jgi:outer membrane murein-binding lipoprotein Lpp